MTNREEFQDAKADREPTPEEEATAERVAKDVDVAEVAESYEHMAELGANVRGEGQVEPDVE